MAELSGAQIHEAVSVAHSSGRYNKGTAHYKGARHHAIQCERQVIPVVVTPSGIGQYKNRDAVAAHGTSCTNTNTVTTRHARHHTAPGTQTLHLSPTDAGSGRHQGHCHFAISQASAPAASEETHHSTSHHITSSWRHCNQYCRTFPRLASSPPHLPW